MAAWHSKLHLMARRASASETLWNSCQFSSTGIHRCIFSLPSNFFKLIPVAIIGFCEFLLLICCSSSDWLVDEDCDMWSSEICSLSEDSISWSSDSDAGVDWSAVPPIHMLVLRLLIVNVVPLDWMLLFLIVLSGNDDPQNQMLEILVLIGRLVHLT